MSDTIPTPPPEDETHQDPPTIPDRKVDAGILEERLVMRIEETIERMGAVIIDSIRQQNRQEIEIVISSMAGLHDRFVQFEAGVLELLQKERDRLQRELSKAGIELEHMSGG